MITKTLFPWIGSKRKNVGHLCEFLPKEWDRKTKTYFEPFLRSGSMFFALQPEHACLGDTHKYISTMYRSLIQNSGKLLEILNEYSDNSSPELYASIKSRILTANEIERAAMYWYLLKCSLFSAPRERADGKGMVCSRSRTRNTCKFDWNHIRQCRDLLAKPSVLFTEQGFEKTLETVTRGDFVFLDPPYIDTRCYYNSLGADELNALVKCIRRLDSLGCFIMFCNKDHEFWNTRLPNFRKVPIPTNTSSRFSNFKEAMYLNY